MYNPAPSYYVSVWAKFTMQQLQLCYGSNVWVSGAFDLNHYIVSMSLVHNMEVSSEKLHHHNFSCISMSRVHNEAVSNFKNLNAHNLAPSIVSVSAWFTIRQPPLPDDSLSQVIHLPINNCIIITINIIQVINISIIWIFAISII